MEISNIYLDFILEAIRHFETKKFVYIKIVSSLSRICFTVTGSDYISLSSLHVCTACSALYLPFCKIFVRWENNPFVFLFGWRT